MTKRWRPLRIAIVALAGAQTVYWLYAVWVAATQNPMGDGLDTVPAFFATPPFLLFTAPALVLASSIGVWWSRRFSPALVCC